MKQTRRDSVFSGHGVVVIAALAAADLTSTSAGFRLRDAQFFTDLFANWLELGKARTAISIQIIQLQRYLEQASKAGAVEIQTLRKRTKRPTYTYRFTDQGFLNLIKSLVGFDHLLRPEELTFLSYVLAEYQEQLMTRLLPESRFHPRAYRNEILELIDPDRILDRQLSLINLIRKDLATRIEESEEIVRFVRNEYAAGTATDSLIIKLDERFSYQLVGQRSFAELFGAVPKSMVGSELLNGFERRNRLLFAQLLRNFDMMAESLQNLRTKISSPK